MQENTDKKNEKQRIEIVHDKQPNKPIVCKCITKPVLCPEVYEGEKKKYKKSGSQECYKTQEAGFLKNRCLVTYPPLLQLLNLPNGNSTDYNSEQYSVKKQGLLFSDIWNTFK